MYWWSVSTGGNEKEAFANVTPLGTGSSAWFSNLSQYILKSLLDGPIMNDIEWIECSLVHEKSKSISHRIPAFKALLGGSSYASFVNHLWGRQKRKKMKRISDHSRFPDFLLKLSWPRKTKMNKNVSKATTMFNYWLRTLRKKTFPNLWSLSRKLVTSQWKIVELPTDPRDDEWGANHLTPVPASTLHGVREGTGEK